MQGEVWTIAGSVLLAVVGYILKYYLGDLRMEKYRARYNFVSDQLKLLYGPLYAMVEANTAAWEAYKKSSRPDAAKTFDRYTDHEKEIWQMWAEHVFIPSNKRMGEVIEQHAHLLNEPEMPDVLLRFIRHIESSKLVLPLMKQDPAETRIIDDFEPWPPQLRSYVEQEYKKVAAEHRELSGRVQLT